MRHYGRDDTRVYDDMYDEEVYDDEEEDEEIPFPKVVFIIIINEFCERFSYFGLRGTLNLYLRDQLHYTEATTLIVFHTFVFFACFFPLFGAFLADSYIGRYKTILFLSVVHALGNVLLAVSAIPDVKSAAEALCIVSLLLVAIGTGGIKPCVCALGGDQFELPQQKKDLEIFFSFFYFAISCGSFLSTIVTPILRHDVHCYGNQDCYPLAFGFPAALMMFAVVIFFLARNYYFKFEPPGYSVTVEWFKCVWYGMTQRCGAKDHVDHWIYRSIGKFREKFVMDCKTTLAVLVLFTPLPMFWALYEQQASSWIFQATRMNGELTTMLILPDQMQFLNTFLILIFIPLFDYFIYPLLGHCNLLTSPLQRMCCGGFLAGIAFLIAGGVSLAIEDTYPVPPAVGHADVRLYNTLKCKMKVYVRVKDAKMDVDYMDFKIMTLKKLKSTNVINFIVAGCESRVRRPFVRKKIKDQTSYYCYLNFKGFFCDEDDLEKDGDGYPKIRTIVDRPRDFVMVHYQRIRGSRQEFNVNSSDVKYHTLPRSGKYLIGDSSRKHRFRMGGIYSILIRMHYAHAENVKVHLIVTPNTVHIMWQLPQIIIITAAEVLMCPTALRFAYTQAPKTMKSFVTSIYLLTEAFGNLLVVIYEPINPFKHHSYTFFIFGGLMILVMFLFMYLAIKYKYVDIVEVEEEEEEEEEEY